MKTTMSHRPAMACPLPDLWHYPHMPLHLAESQVSPATDLSHGRASFLGNLHTQEKHSALDISQDSRACAFPCISWVLAAEGKGGGGVPRAVHCQPKVQMKQINSSSTREPQCWSSCYGSLHSQLWSSQRISQNGAAVIASLLSHPLKAPTQREDWRAPVSTQQGQPGMGRFLTLSPSIHMCRVTSQTLVIKRNI